MEDKSCNKKAIGFGGPWANAVYENLLFEKPEEPVRPVVKGTKWIGCYKDDGARDFCCGPK